MPIIKITDEEMKERGGRLSSDPAVAKLYALIKAEAERRGGKTLDIWQLHMGKIWNRPYIMSSDSVAEKLGLPLSVVDTAINDVRAAVRSEWMASEEYKRSKFNAD
jgi:hypothetical protein